MLADKGHFLDALHYARAALHSFESYSGLAKEWRNATKKLIAKLEEEIEKIKEIGTTVNNKEEKEVAYKVIGSLLHFSRPELVEGWRQVSLVRNARTGYILFAWF